jgi:hypothetical protein
MAITKLSQEQTRNSRSYDQTIAAGLATMVTAATDNQYDLNALRSQSKRITGKTNWYEAPDTSIASLNTAVGDIEDHSFLFNTQVLTSVSVGSSNNFVVLSVTGSQAPTENAANTTGEGAVCAYLASGEFGANRTSVVTGANALQPYNLVLIRDASTNDVITSNGQTVFGLLQAENGTVNGDAFNDTTKRVQISFVRDNGSNSLEAVPAADIQGKSIKYSYITRKSLTNLPQNATLSGSFADHIAAAEVTLQNAYDNQGATAVEGSTSFAYKVGASNTYKLQNSDASVDLVSVDGTSASMAVSFGANTSITGTLNSSSSASFDTAGQSISIGSTTGAISSAASLSLSASGATSNVTLSAGGSIILSDSAITGSNYSGDLKIAANNTEVNSFVSNYGSVSLISAINTALNTSAASVVEYVLTSDVANTGDFDPSAHTNINSGTDPDWTTNSISTAVIYINGRRLVYGTNYDFEVGTTPADGEISFASDLYTGDVIAIEYS